MSASSAAIALNSSTVVNAPALDDFSGPYVHELSLLSELFLSKGLGCTFELDDWGVGLGSAESRNRTLFRFKDRHSAKRFLCSRRILRFAEVFLEGKVEIEGDFSHAIDCVAALEDQPDSIVSRFQEACLSIYARLAKMVGVLGSSDQHYDIPAEFYQLFLDPHMQYTCGYFGSGAEDLGSGQLAKLELIADRLQFREGLDHLDIGCGWGGLLNFVATKHRTKSVGISTSQNQVQFARDNIQRNGLSNVQVLNGDFSEVVSVFDRITVVGMLEHVSKSRKPEFYRFLSARLRPGGRAYVQCITKSQAWMGGDGSRFLQRYVFPGFFLESEQAVERNLKAAGLHVEESIPGATDYSRTMKYWLETLRQKEHEAVSIVGVVEYRKFLAYLGMAAKLFAEGRGSLSRFIVRKD